LICQYSDPNRPDAERRKAAQAAIAYEKPRVGGAAETQVFNLYALLEEKRLTRPRPQLVELKPSDPDPAA
jgi:hypothetical protein